jgi:hypothetical protein
LLLLLLLVSASPSFGACQITLSRPTLNYGHVHDKNYVGQFRRWKTLSEREVQLTALCDKPTVMAIFTHSGDHPFGLRFASDSLIAAVATHAVLDGKPVQLGRTLRHTPFLVRGETRDKKLILNDRGILPMSGNRMLEGQKFTMTLKFIVALSERDTLVKDSTTLESHLRFSVETQ